MSAQIIELHPIASAADSAFTVERIDAGGLAAIVEPWRDLAGRALERNVFYEPDFMLPAARYLAGGRATFVLVWQNASERRRLAGFFPLAMPRLTWRGTLIRGWRHPYMVDGAPLLDQATAPKILDAFMTWADRQKSAGILFPALALDEPFAATLAAKARRDRRLLHVFDPHERAVLRHGAHPDHPPKRAREWRRLRARLAEQGELETRSFRDPKGVREAFELFLALEKGGWKGRGGSGMMQSPSVAAFAREAMRGLAASDKCRIDVMVLADTPIAAAIVLESGGKAFYWKTAYDEAYARFSPGVQITLDLTRLQLADATKTETDSCAVPGHPMIDPIWPERLRIGDMFVGTGPAREAATHVALSSEDWRRRLRTLAKQGLKRLRR